MGGQEETPSPVSLTTIVREWGRIFCAWRLRGRIGAAVGGAAFIIPGLIVILGLAALFLGASPPLWALGAGAGADAAVPAVAIQVGVGLTGAISSPPGATVLAAALILLLALRRDVVLTLLCAGAAGVIITLLLSGLDPAAGDAGRDDADEQLPLPGGPGLDARPFG